MMENLNPIPPTVLPAETAGAPPSDVPQPDGNFAAVLEESLCAGGPGEPGEGNTATDAPAAPDPAYLLAGISGFAFPGAAVKQDPNVFPTDSEPARGGEPSTAPVVVPAPSRISGAVSGPPVPANLDGSRIEGAPFAGGDGELFAGRIPENEAGGGEPSVFSFASQDLAAKTTHPPDAEGEILPPLEDSTRPGARPNLSRGDVISPEETGLPKPVEAGPKPDASTAAQARKVTIPAVQDGDSAADKGKTELSQALSPAQPDELPGTSPSKPVEAGPAHARKPAGDSAPRGEMPEPRFIPGEPGIEGDPAPGSSETARVFPPRGSQGLSTNGRGEGQENAQPQGSDPAYQAGKEVQGRVDPYGTSFAVREAGAGPIEKGEVKETGASVPAKEIPGVSRQVAGRLIWSIRHNEETVRMNLDPPHLGHIVLEINRSKDNIQTTLWTDNPQTRAVLESGQIDIQRIVENEGFRLEKFNVLVQQDARGFQGDREGSLNPQSWNGGRPPAGEETGFQPADPVPAAPGAAISGSRSVNLLV